ncbi:ABC transporter ATP-binding protein [Methanobrevibacter sp.]|uniref:ABC transporter ATP-binding protein n=1 Tax=Methanobrevibacter sp. TaxID=66852 RepID=UPI0025FF4951|nr:ABC transporter ATP-binding protein [Methanobrevibacter sp.]MBR4447318.1 ABC transporter ATP-binding protein [Methanobrevibacter sp.]
MGIRNIIDKIFNNTSINYNSALESGVAIKVEHLTMEFKVSNDKIDTIKEYVIRTIKRNKGETKTVKVLDDISFTVNRGEKLGILGFNGAGKSTLLRIIAGIYEPTEGDITINGKIAPLLELSAGFDKNYSGKDNIYLNGALLSMDKEYLDSKYDEIVEYSELGDYINFPVKNYSKGMKAKLGFSIATLIDPDILIIDEILSVGDIKFRKKSGEKINEMMAEGVTVLLVSHSINQVRRICDRCIWIDNGKLIMEGPADEVCDAYVEDANYARIKKEKKMKRKLRKKYG